MLRLNKLLMYSLVESAQEIGTDTGLFRPDGHRFLTNSATLGILAAVLSALSGIRSPSAGAHVLLDPHYTHFRPDVGIDLTGEGRNPDHVHEHPV